MNKLLIAALIAAFLAAPDTARAQLDKPPQQVVLETKFVEVAGEYRNFLNWKTVSGDDPSVVSHDASSNAGGLLMNIGTRLGGFPLWLQAGGYVSAGLSTNTTLANGDRIHGRVKDFGAGAGVRLVPFHGSRSAFFLWAMAYYDRNNGDFKTFDVDGSTRTETRVHSGFLGDYGIGMMYLIDESVALDLGASYTGIFNTKNADENVRLRIGLILNVPSERYF